MICTVVEKFFAHRKTKDTGNPNGTQTIRVRDAQRRARFGYILEQLHFSFTQLLESNIWKNWMVG
jgi:hypothetical protein